MKNILRVTVLAICAIFMVANVSAQGTYDQATMGAKVVEMETASWGQNSPFNNLCPKVGTTPTKTGCGPTAFAILCHYYKWPISGSGSVTHNNETLDLSTHTYDYDNMLLNYSGSYTEEQATAVATLMRDLGYAAKVGYGTSATSFSENIKALKNYFSYTNSIFNPSGTGMDVLYRSDVGDESFMQQLKECLSQGYPILFTSLVDDNNPNTTDGRHIFILDGYTENNYFHFNFGWNGYGNGWYNLDNVRPDDESDYSTQQRAYLYVIPNRTKRTVTANVSPAGAGSVTVNGNANSAEVIENTYATLTATANSGYTFSHWSKNGTQVSTEKTYKAVVAAEGNDYVANFLTVGNSRVNVSVTYNSNYGTVTYNGNAVQGTSITPYQNSEVTLVATPLDGYVFNGWTVTKGTNSTNYSGTELTFVATGDMSVEARFSLAVSDYTISTSNITKSDYLSGSSSYCSTWKTADGIVLSATYGSEKAYALSASNPLLYAKAATESSGDNLNNGITFTLTAPNGYSILNYSIGCYSNSSSYSVDVTPEGGSTTNVDNNFSGTISANVNAASARFTLSSTYAGRAAIYFKNFTVTLQKEGTEGSTPTPDPEPEPEPTPTTTYTVNTTANPANGGTAKFAVGTGSQKTQGDVENGTQITLYATANSGYNFVNWTLNGTVVGTTETCNVTASQAANYVANFEANTPAEPTTSLAGKFFRIKVYNDNRYMNVKNHTEHAQKVTAGGVNIAAKVEDSNAQIFFFEQSGNGYMLKDGDGYYIKGLEWSVDASSTTIGSVLLFEETAIEDVYYIKWNNTYKGDERYFKVGADSNGAGDHPYCDVAANQKETAAAKWVLEEVIPSNEKTLDVTFNNATYTKTDGTELTSGWGYQVVTQTTPAVTIKVAESKNNFGYTTGVISGVKTPYLYKSTNFILLVPEPYKITGYKMTVKGQDGNYSGDVTCTVDGTETSKATLSGTTTQTLSATGLNTSTVNIGVGGNAGNGIFITALEIYYTGEEVEEPEETELFPDGAYKIYWEQNNRGYLAYHNGTWPNEAVLADVTLSNYGSSHYNSTTDPVDLVWYLITADDGKRYLFEAETGKFLGVNTGLSTGGGKANKLSTTEAWPIAIEENTKHAGYYIITTMIDNTNNLLCSGCGSSSKNGAHPVRWLTVNDNNQNDGGAPLKLVKVDNVTVANDVMSMVKSVINNSGKVPFKVEIEGLRENDPNTHFATVTVGGTTVKLAPAHLTQSEIEATLVAGSTLAINHKYRGFEFNGFYIGEESLGESATLTTEQIAAISATTPLVAKFTATNTGEATLFSAEDEFSYRIPAIAKTGNGMLVAVSDYRHNLDDIGRDNHGTGTKRIDLVMRTSDDNGATWSETKTIAAGDNSKTGSYLRAFGDAAIAAVGQNIVVMAAAGDVVYTAGTTSSPNKMARIYSSDNGATWAIEEMTTKMYSQSTSLIPSGGSAFFGSGKLAVDPNFNGTGNARIYGALLVRIGTDGYNNFGVFSDDLGATWKILGGDNTNPVAKGDEPKVEILPNGQILLSARRGGGRVFRVFTYGDDKANGVGSWGDAAVNGCDNGGQNATNGEIICLDAKRPNGKRTKILLQSQPKGGSGQYERYNVTIWYKEVSADETYTPSSIASGWTQGLEVCPAGVKSAYSAMALQANGEIAFFFEEAPCYGDDHTKGYSMVYVPLTIEEITNNNFLNPNADVEYVPVEFNIELTDTEGNIYRETLDYVPNDAAAVATYLTTTYPFITLGENGVKTENGYTNTVTLPFKVSNANTTVWHNIYWPANTRESDYPVYLSASSKDDTYVPKVTGSYAYGNHPTYNTLDGNEKISWAIYNVNNGFEFIFKNKVTDKYIQVTSVATGNAQNVQYVENIEDATAFTIFNKPAGNDYYTSAQYALAAKVGETTGYLCSTSATGYNYATHYFNNSNNGYGHQGAWIEFVEAPDYQGIYDKLIADINNFGDGEGKYKDDNTISGINKDALRTMLFSDLTAQATAVQTVKDSYTEITLTVPEVNEAVPGSVKILEEAVSNKFVKKGEVTIEAVPATGYYFVNWTKPAAQASAAARTAEARNAVEVVSTDNPYTFDLTDAVSLEANFEQVVVDVVLTEIIGTNAGQTNEYHIQLTGFTNGITKETVAAKLVEQYPYIALGEKREDEVVDNGKLQINGNSYTYTNNVILPFKVSNAQNEIWHNIYWPSNTKNNDYPVYLSASSADDTYVPKVTGSYAYGDHPTYNTSNGNDKISWAIYNVNNGFEFTFKNKVTGKYIQVTSVANGDAQNVVYVEKAIDATVFTIEKKPAGNDYYTDAQYSLTANVGEEKGYLCSTSATGYNYATHYNSNGHQGAWFEFVESPYYEVMLNDTYAMYYYYAGVGEGKCIITDALVPIVENLGDFEKWGGLTYNTINEYAAILVEAWKWPAIKLNINPTEGGTTSINGEENVTKKKAPVEHSLPLVATPAIGYHFVNWSDSTSTVLSENIEYTTSTSGPKNWVTNITVNFAKNIYTINVSASEGGSAYIVSPGTTSTTVEHGTEVALTAVANDGYEFAGWYDGDVLVSTEANYTIDKVTSDINYTARFNEKGQTTYAIHVTVASTDGTEVTNTPEGNVMAIIDGIGMEWATDAEFVADANVALSATSDHNEKGYLFDGWYKNGELVGKEKDIVVKATETATYEARFFRGCIVIGKSNNIRFGRVMGITNADGTTIGYDASSRAVVKAGTTVKINTMNIMYGYEVGSWINTNDEIVGTDNSLIVEVNEDATYTAIFEPASYNLTVRANDDSYGTVSAASGTLTGTAIKVGHNMEATITATANDGYYFVNWTIGTEVVSTSATYTIAGIENVEDMQDVEYIANFLPVENAVAGVYYRIGYDGFAAAASAGAARAATDETLTYTITPSTVGLTTTNKVSELNYEKLSIRTTDNAKIGNPVNAIMKVGDDQFYFYGYNSCNSIKYTLSVPEGYIITGYSFDYSINKTSYPCTIIYSGGTITSPANLNWYPLNATENAQTAEFTITASKDHLNSFYYIRNFEVYIQKVGGEGEGTPETPETPSNRYYIQSVASDVTNKANALLMTQDTTATSIFYYADSKLLSYDKGTYVKEDGGTRGLQAVGTSGTVTITTTGETATIAAPSYMHANKSGTTYFVDHCGSNNGDTEHNFVLEEVETLPVTISDALHATFYAPVAVAIPEGVKAYVLKAENIHGIGTYAWMTSLKNGIIPANTGVIIKGAKGTYYFDIVENSDAARAEAVGNVLSGTVAKTKITEDAYILANRDGKIGLYPVAKNSYLNNSTTATTVRFTNNSHKAYLPVTNDWFGEQLKKGTGFRFVYDDEETTGIDEFETEIEDTIYDLQGRKLSEITEPGIYIVGGKKVWIK